MGCFPGNTNAFSRCILSAAVPAFRASWHFMCVSQRIARTLVGQEHAPTKTSPGRDLCGRLQSFGAARPWLRLALGLAPDGARPHISVRVRFHVFRVLGQYSRVVVIMRLTVLATIAIAKVFVIMRTIMAINSCTSPRSHIGTSIIPSPTTVGRGPCKCMFLLALCRHTHPQRTPLFARPPFGFTHCRKTVPTSRFACKEICTLHVILMHGRHFLNVIFSTQVPTNLMVGSHARKMHNHWCPKPSTRLGTCPLCSPIR